MIQKLVNYLLKNLLGQDVKKLDYILVKHN